MKKTKICENYRYVVFISCIDVNIISYRFSWISNEFYIILKSNNWNLIREG